MLEHWLTIFGEQDCYKCKDNKCVVDLLHHRPVPSIIGIDYVNIEDQFSWSQLRIIFISYCKPESCDKIIAGKN